MSTISSGEKSDSRDVKVGYCKILKSCRLITCYLSARIEKNHSAGRLELRLNEDGGSDGNNVFKSFDLSGACNVVVTCDKENLSVSHKGDVVWMIMKSFEESVDWGYFLCSNMSSSGPIIKNSSNSAKSSPSIINSNSSSNNNVSNVFQPRPPQDVPSSKMISSPRGKSTIASARNRGLSEGEVNLLGSSISDSPSILNPIAESRFRSPVSYEAHHVRQSSYANEKSQIFSSMRKKGGYFSNLENNSLHSNQEDLLNVFSNKKSVRTSILVSSILGSASIDIDKTLTKKIEENEAIYEARSKAVLKREELAKLSKERDKFLKNNTGIADPVIKEKVENIERRKQLGDEKSKTRTLQEEKRLEEIVLKNRIEKIQESLKYQYKKEADELEKVKKIAATFKAFDENQEKRERDRMKYIQKMKNKQTLNDYMDSKFKEIAITIIESLKNHKEEQKKNKEDKINWRKITLAKLKVFSENRSQKVIAKCWKLHKERVTKRNLYLFVKLQARLRSFLVRRRLKIGLKRHKLKKVKISSEIVRKFLMSWVLRRRGLKLLNELLLQSILKRALLKRAAIVKGIFARSVSFLKARNVSYLQNISQNKSSKSIKNIVPSESSPITDGEKIKKKKRRYHRSKSRCSSDDSYELNTPGLSAISENSVSNSRKSSRDSKQRSSSRKASSAKNRSNTSESISENASDSESSSRASPIASKNNDTTNHTLVTENSSDSLSKFQKIKSSEKMYDKEDSNSSDDNED